MELFDEDSILMEKPRCHGKPLQWSISLPQCPISSEVMKKVADRANQGMKTYGVTMARTDIDAEGWADHLLEELLDAACYLVRLKQDIAKLNKTIEEWNDE